MKRYTLPQSSFLLLLGVVTLAYFWILLPFFGAVFWGVVFAIVFAPLYATLLNALGNRPNSAALLALLLILLMVIMPMAMIAASMVDQASAVYTMINTGQIDFNVMFKRVIAALPTWAISVLERF
jgi:predicted PurR-regulated permease PerM